MNRHLSRPNCRQLAGSFNKDTQILAGPTNTVAPVLTNGGTGDTGDVLTVTNGTWTTLGTISSYTYQWRRGGSIIVGEISNTYVLAASDDELLITCRVTATDEFGSRSRTSNSVGPYDLVVNLYFRPGGADMISRPGGVDTYERP